MQYHFNRSVRLDSKSKFANLYSWSLRETSDADEQFGSDQVPWPWTLYFHATELRYFNSLTIEDWGDSTDAASTDDKVTFGESIVARLQSGSQSMEGSVRDPVEFSMFGTDRVIEDFRLTIRPTKQDLVQAVCRIWGGVSYTAETDFRAQTQNDCVEISVELSTDRFNSLRDEINKSKPDNFAISIGGVSGFYSDWSPSITTHRIKILTDGTEHRVEVETGSDIEPPRLGRVREFNFSARNRLSLIAPSRVKLPASDEHLRDGQSEKISLDSDFSRALVETLTASRATLDRLKWPIYLIIFLLVLLYLK